MEATRINAICVPWRASAELPEPAQNGSARVLPAVPVAQRHTVGRHHLGTDPRPRGRQPGEVGIGQLVRVLNVETGVQHQQVTDVPSPLLVRLQRLDRLVEVVHPLVQFLRHQVVDHPLYFDI